MNTNTNTDTDTLVDQLTAYAVLSVALVTPDPAPYALANATGVRWATVAGANFLADVVIATLEALAHDLPGPRFTAASLDGAVERFELGDGILSTTDGVVPVYTADRLTILAGEDWDVGDPSAIPAGLTLASLAGEVLQEVAFAAAWQVLYRLSGVYDDDLDNARAELVGA